MRGKTARVAGDLQTLLTLLKGLLFGYNRDLQEDKEALFDAPDTTVAAKKSEGSTAPAEVASALAETKTILIEGMRTLA